MAEGSSFQSFIKDFTFTPATATTNINADIKTKMQLEDEEEEGEEASLRNAPSPNKSGDGDLALTLAPATCLADRMGDEEVGPDLVQCQLLDQNEIACKSDCAGFGGGGISGYRLGRVGRVFLHL